jgi:putative membrane protein
MNLKNSKHKSKLILSIVVLSIIAASLVPMLYSTIYLGSVWDVYGKINKVPVAFVNQDKSVTKDGKEYSIGKDLKNSIKDKESVAWKFVSYEDAMKGLDGTDYFAVIEIPDDFSQKIADAQDGNFKNPEIIYIGNKGKNFVFSQVSSKVADSIKTEVSSNIQKEISKALVDSLYDVKVSINEASDGSSNLQEGIQKLVKGSKDLSNGIFSAANGSSQLKDGLVNANTGASTLQNGTQKLLDGSNNLATGLTNAASGSSQLKKGLNQIYDGQKQITDGESSLLNGLNILKSNLTKPNDDLSRLSNGAKALSTGTEQLKEASKNLTYENVNALATGVIQTGNYISNATHLIDENLYKDLSKGTLTPEELKNLTTIVETMQQLNSKDISTNIGENLSVIADSIKPLPNTLQQLNDGSNNVSTGINTLITGISSNQAQASEGVDQLISGLQRVKDSSTNLQAGLSTAVKKTDELAAGLEQLSGGAVSLKNGLGDVNDGAVNLKNGLSTASVSSGKLADGINELYNGSATLNDGLILANDGAIALKDGLHNGYEKLGNNLKFNSENMSQFVSKPITLKDNSINDVKYYGMGLAPYFISLSLWLGAMFLSAIFSIAKSQKAFKSSFMNSFIRRYIAGIGIVAIQAILLSFTLIKILGVNPVSILSFYANNILISITFFSIMYGVSYVMGILSAPLMFIVLLLQLASSGGTFPIETAPVFYRIVGKIIPMTYSVNNLRMILSGVNSSLLSHNIIIMAIFILIFMCGGVVLRTLMNLGKNRDQIAEQSKVA